MPPLNTFDGSKYHIRSATGRNYRLNWLVLHRGITKANLHRAAEPLVAATKWCKYSCKRLSVLWWILQSKHKALTFLLCPKQQSWSSYNSSALRTTLFSKLKRDSADDNHTWAQYSRLGKHVHWNHSSADVNNKITFQPGARHQGLDTSSKWVSNVNLESKVTPKMRRLFTFSSS